MRNVKSRPAEFDVEKRLLEDDSGRKLRSLGDVRTVETAEYLRSRVCVALFEQHGESES